MAQRHVDVLLIGGGVAAVRCARTLRRRAFDGSIVLVGEEAVLPYNRPPLSKELLRGEVPLELIAAESESWYERQRVEVLLSMPVVSLDAEARLAVLADGSSISFDRCLLATGAAPRRPPIPGAEHALLLRTLDDALAIRERAVPGGRAVVIGGGFIGVEVAASLASAGVRVTVVELEPSLWGRSLGEELSAWAAEVLRSAGVSLRLGSAVSRVEASAVFIGQERLAADLVIAGVGVTPRVELAAGLTLDDGIVTDARRRTSAAGIFAAGDVARVDGLRVEHWHAAREGGEAAALAMLELPAPPRRAPWVFSEFAGASLEVVGNAPEPDEIRRIGSAPDRFALAYLRDGVVAQLAIVNGAIPVEAARTFVEQGSALDKLNIGPD